MVASPNVGCFLRLSRFQGHLDLLICKLQCERIAKKTSEKFHKIPNFRAFSLRDFFKGSFIVSFQLQTFRTLHSISVPTAAKLRPSWNFQQLLLLYIAWNHGSPKVPTMQTAVPAYT